MNLIVSTDKYYSDEISKELVDYLNNEKIDLNNAVVYYEYPIYMDIEDQALSPKILLISPNAGVLVLNCSPVSSVDDVSILDEETSQIENYLFSKFIKSKTENKKSKIISIAGFESTAKTIFIIDLINSIKTKEKNVLLINMNILNQDIEQTFKNNISSKVKIKKAKNFLFENGEIIGKNNIVNKIDKLKKEYDYIIINNNAECYFELNHALMEKAENVYFVIEKNIKDIKISNNLLNIYEKNWNLKTEKIKVILINIKIRKNKIKNTDIEILPYKNKEREISYKKTLMQKRIYKKLTEA